MSRKRLIAGLSAVAAAAVAVLALGLGGAYASDPKPEKGILWAVVNGDGTFARQSERIIQVERVGTGQYRVLAKKDVRSCAYQVTGGDDGLGVPPRTYGNAAQHLTDARGVYVETYDASGDLVDGDFYLAILC
jgi:hypothetical protein